jgi:hypothetical protein
MAGADGVDCSSQMRTLWRSTIETGTEGTMLRVISSLFIDIVTTNDTLRVLKTGINHNDHTQKSRVKGDFHARFGIGGGEGNLSADHTSIT